MYLVVGIKDLELADCHIPPEHMNMITLKGKRFRIQLDVPISSHQLPYDPMHDDLTLRYKMYSKEMLDMFICSNKGFHELDKQSYSDAIDDVMQKIHNYSKEILKDSVFYNCRVTSTTYHEEYTWPSSDESSSDDEN